MDYKLNIILINAHTKSRCCNDNLNFVIDKSVLVIYFFTTIHLAVESACNKTILIQFFSKYRSSLCPRDINDCGAIFFFYQGP